jgi:hypothetical protein
MDVDVIMEIQIICLTYGMWRLFKEIKNLTGKQ